MKKLILLTILTIGLTAACLESVSESTYDYQKSNIDRHEVHKIEQRCKQAHKKNCECQKEINKYIENHEVKPKDYEKRNDGSSK